MLYKYVCIYVYSNMGIYKCIHKFMYMYILNIIYTSNKSNIYINIYKHIYIYYIYIYIYIYTYIYIYIKKIGMPNRHARRTRARLCTTTSQSNLNQYAEGANKKKRPTEVFGIRLRDNDWNVALFCEISRRVRVLFQITTRISLMISKKKKITTRRLL